MPTELGRLTSQCADLIGRVDTALGRPRQHVWVRRARYKWQTCRVCGVVKRADAENKPCPGPVAVGARLTQRQST